jgi:hypothetical protein
VRNPHSSFFLNVADWVYNRRAFESSGKRGWRVGRRAPDTRRGRNGGGGPIHPANSSTDYVCGPDVTDQIATLWLKIQQDFALGRWPEAAKAAVSADDARRDVCKRILFPFTPLPDFNGWDTLPLFEGDDCSDWLESFPCCCSPTNPDWDEDPDTCSHSVQVKGQCWLNGTVNYGTYGIMVRLCHDKFSDEYSNALSTAERWIQAYKLLASWEDDTLPLAWLRATYHGGPRAVPPNPGNRPQCKCSCPYDGSVLKEWDYVWEPWKSRARATKPGLPVFPPVVPPSAPVPAPAPPVVGVATTTYVVMPGDSLSKIAAKFYGNPSSWSKIYNTNKAIIGSHPNFIKPGQTLVIP